MKYYRFVLVDLGYMAPVAGIDPLPEIWGLSNKNEETFVHKGFSGYPGSGEIITEKTGTVLVAFADAAEVPEEGVLVDDPLHELIVEFGWPDDTTIGDDGKPVAPVFKE